MESYNEEAIFDDVIKMIGNDGKFQKRFNWWFNFILVIFASMAYLNIYLVMNVPDHWCYIPGREKTNLTIEEWKEIYLPKEYDENGRYTYSKCTFYSDTNSAHHANNTNIQECNEGWEYDRTWFESTLPQQENWVCEKELYVTNTFAFNRMGELVGTFIFGQLADAIGRKPVFFLTLITAIVGRVMNALTASIPSLFYASALISGLPSLSVVTAPLIIAVEICKPEKRAYVSLIQGLGWTLGTCILPFILWAVKDWMYFIYLTTFPLAIYLFSKNCIIESPRWLSSKRKTKKCIQEMEKIAKVNTSKLPSNITTLLTKQNEKEKVYGVLALCSSFRLAKNNILLNIGWSISISIYFLFTLNINNLSGNPYMNYFWQGLSEFPAYVLAKYASDRFGRRFTSSISFLGTIIGCIPVLFIIKDESKAFLVPIICIYLKFAITMSFYVIYLQSVEIYPTCVRQTGKAIENISGYALGVGIPYIIYLGSSVDASYPYAISAVLCGIGFLSVIGLPETLHHILPETLAEAAVFGADQNIWGKQKKVRNMEEEENQ